MGLAEMGAQLVYLTDIAKQFERHLIVLLFYYAYSFDYGVVD